MPESFRDFELAAWQRIPEQYHEGFGALTRQCIEPLLDAAGVREGARVLDVASGPGYVAEAASKRGAAVTGIDFAAPMVAHARARCPGIDFREGDAESLPFDERSFDAVVMSFGILHLDGPERALREAFRVLRPGGRFAFTVWATPDFARGFDIVLGAVRMHGNPDVPLPPGPPFFRYSDAATAAQALRDVGFADPLVVQVPQLWRLPSEGALFDIMRGATARTAGLLAAQSPEALRAIASAMAKEAAAFRRGDAVEIPMPAMLASAGRS